jgi:hypothetical protein
MKHWQRIATRLIVLVFVVGLFVSQAVPVFAVARTLYWVGGNSAWNSVPGAKWSLASGGVGGEAIPDSDDNAIFDGGSGVVTVQLAGATCANLSCTGGTGDFAGSFTSSGLSTCVYGSLSLSGSMLTGFPDQTVFLSTAAGKTITTNGKTVGDIIFSGVGGEWTLQDSLTASQIAMVNGSLITNNQNVTVGEFGVDGATLDLGTSIMSVLVGWGIIGGAITANTATINMTGTPLYFQGGGETYGDVSITGIGTGFILGGTNTFANLSIVGRNAINDSLIITDDQVITGLLTLTGYNSTTKKLRVKSNNPLITQYQISTDTADITNCNISDISGAGGFAAPYWNLSIYTYHDTDYGNNANILFPRQAAAAVADPGAGAGVALVSAAPAQPGNMYTEGHTGGLFGLGAILDPALTAANIPVEVFWYPVAFFVAILLGFLAYGWTRTIIIQAIVSAVTMAAFCGGGALGDGLLPYWTVLVFVIEAVMVFVIQEKQNA